MERKMEKMEGKIRKIAKKENEKIIIIKIST